MRGYLLDTNVPSEMTRPRPAPQVERWLDQVDDKALFLSVISLSEILRGIMRLPESAPHEAPNLAGRDIAPLV